MTAPAGVSRARPSPLGAPVRAGLGIKRLLAGDGDVIADIYRQRVLKRGGRPQTWGWEIAYPASKV